MAILKQRLHRKNASGEYDTIYLETSSKRTCRFVVGTSTAGWTTADCDYLCDGKGDQVEIQAAIDALPENGGEIVILDGEYDCHVININKNNVSIIGNGGSTVIKLMYSGCTIDVSAERFRVSNLLLYGENPNTQSAAGVGVSLSNGCKWCTVTGVIFYKLDEGISTSPTSSFITVSNCMISDCGEFGILSNSTELILNSCIVVNNAVGICLNSPYCKLNEISSNIFKDNGTGIEIRQFVTYSEKNLILSNIIFRGSGTAADYSSDQYTIKCDGSNNLIIGNMLYGKNYTDSGSGNTFANNKYN